MSRHEYSRFECVIVYVPARTTYSMCNVKWSNRTTSLVIDSVTNCKQKFKLQKNVRGPVFVRCQSLQLAKKNPGGPIPMLKTRDDPDSFQYPFRHPIYARKKKNASLFPSFSCWVWTRLPITLQSSISAVYPRGQIIDIEHKIAEIQFSMVQSE